MNRDLQYVVLDNARDIGMPSYIGQIEHPYEIMACMMAEIMLRETPGPVEGGEGSVDGEVETVVWESFWNKDFDSWW